MICVSMDVLDIGSSYITLAEARSDLDTQHLPQLNPHVFTFPIPDACSPTDTVRTLVKSTDLGACSIMISGLCSAPKHIHSSTLGCLPPFSKSQL